METPQTHIPAYKSLTPHAPVQLQMGRACPPHSTARTHAGCVLLGSLFSTVVWTVSPPHQKIR